MQKKYQVFISSTFLDLSEERQDAIRTVLDLGHIPAGMELFPAADVEQLNYIKRIIDECDYYVLIMGGRYGSLDAEGVSYTEREYDYAQTTGKTVLAFIHADPGILPVNKSDTSERLLKNLEEFKDKVSKGRLVRFWKDRAALDNLVTKALAKAFSEVPAVGWVRANVVASSDLLEQSNRLLEENAKLKSKIAELVEKQSAVVDDIADLDETFQVRFRTRYVVHSVARYTDHKAILTWRELFFHVAAKLDTGRTSVAIFNGFKDALKEKKSDKNPYDMDDTDNVRIKMQMLANRLITTEVSRTQAGVFEFLHLTDAGKRFLLEHAVSRSQKS